MEQLRWVKSGHSNPNGNCVEVASLADGGTAMRNSRHPDGAVLRFTAAEMAAFAAGVKSGEFDFLIATPRPPAGPLPIWPGVCNVGALGSDV